MSFSTLDEIRDEFGITSTDHDEIRSHLRSVQSELHPDKSGGQFASDTHKERYHRVQEALTFFGPSTASSKAVVPTDAMTELVKIVRDLLPTRQAESAETRLNTTVSTAITGLRGRYRKPRVTTSAISIVLSALWLFPDQVTEHPVLGQYLDPGQPLFGMLWVGSLALTVMIWTATAMAEDRRRQFLGMIKTEGWQNRRLGRFIYDSRVDAEGDRRISKDRFVEELMHFRSNRRAYGGDSLQRALMPPWLDSVVDEMDPELAQSVADTVFARAEARGILRRDPRPSLTDLYVVAE